LPGHERAIPILSSVVAWSDFFFPSIKGLGGRPDSQRGASAKFQLATCNLEIPAILQFAKRRPQASRKHKHLKPVTLAPRLRFAKSIAGSIQMADLMFILITVIFFVVATVYVRACDRL
jgi:hypothetical protein